MSLVLQLFLFWLAVIITAPMTSALFFHLGETEKKCFIEDIPDDTMVEGIYKVEMFDRIQDKYTLTLSGFGMLVEVQDEDKKVVMSKVRRTFM